MLLRYSVLSVIALRSVGYQQKRGLLAWSNQAAVRWSSKEEEGSCFFPGSSPQHAVQQGTGGLLGSWKPAAQQGLCRTESGIPPFQVTDINACLSRHPEVTGESAATKEKIAQLLD